MAQHLGIPPHLLGLADDDVRRRDFLREAAAGAAGAMLSVDLAGWVRSGDDKRGSWRLEWDHSYSWRLAQEFVANGSGWNPQADPRPLGVRPPGPELEPFLLRELAAADVPTEVSALLVKLVLDRGPDARNNH